MGLKDFELQCLNEIHSFFEDLRFKLVLSEEFGAKDSDSADQGMKKHQQEIQRYLLEQKWPSPTSGHVSISHTVGCGAIFFHPNLGVGIDIELSSRVQMKVVSRVSSSRELSLQMHPSELWVAKESSFKSLRNYQQPQTISEIEILTFCPEAKSFEFGLSQNPAIPMGQGLLWQSAHYTLGIAFIKT